MNDIKILLVDDEPHALEAYKRTLHGNYKADTADNPAEALEAIQRGSRYAVIISDMYMPGSDGISFLSQVRSASPDTVRIMLTGHADVQLAMEAMHRGNIFRFLTKPCPPDLFLSAVSAAVQQYALITAEKELLQKTLSGSVRVLTEILSMIDPVLFGRITKVRQLIKELSKYLGYSDIWRLELTATLSNIGLVSIPPEVIVKSKNGEPLMEREKRMLERVPTVSSDIIALIPRMESVAKGVLYHDKHYDGTGYPADNIQGEWIPFEARIAKVALDLAELLDSGKTSYEAIDIMRRRSGWYDPKLMDALFLAFVTPSELAYKSKDTALRIGVDELMPGQKLISSIETKDGATLLSSGHILTVSAVEKIKNIAALKPVKEPILVEVMETDEGVAA